MRPFIPLALWLSSACLGTCRPSSWLPDRTLGRQRSLQGMRITLWWPVNNLRNLPAQVCLPWLQQAMQTSSPRSVGWTRSAAMWLTHMNSLSGTGWLTGSLAAALSLASPSWTMTSTLTGKSLAGKLICRMAQVADCFCPGGCHQQPHWQCCSTNLHAIHTSHVALELQQRCQWASMAAARTLCRLDTHIPACTCTGVRRKLSPHSGRGPGHCSLPLAQLRTL